MFSRRTALLVTLLGLLNILVFAQTLRYGFIDYDDGQYVFQNEAVRAGLTPRSISWAWSSASLGYHPLTWLSHMLDVQMYGLRPAGHHASAVLLHILSTCILFFALRSITGDELRSAIVAALFAIHPAHVESVAWISERKDTLSTFFGMLALAAYGRFARDRTLLNGIWIFLAFTASLLSKQMLMTLPFVFLLLDYWPLRRRALAEKIPFFALTVAAVLVAFVGQRNLNALQSAEAVPLSARIGNATVAYAAYLRKLVWPTNLAVLFPFNRAPIGEIAIAAAVVIAITVVAIVFRRKAPHLLVGWLWFLGTLVPVIGLVQLAGQGMADRYTYFPYIGLFIAIVWSVRPKQSWVFVPIVVVLAVVAFHQTRYWKDSETLFEHTLAVTGPNPLMEYSLAHTLERKDPDRALEHFRRSLQFSDRRTLPAQQHAQIYVGIGNVMMMKGRAQEAADSYRRAIEIDPAGTGNAQRNLQKLAPPQAQDPLAVLFDRGVRQLNGGDIAGAIATFQEAVKIAPDAVDARIYLSIAFIKAQRNAEAIEQLEIARKLDAARAEKYVMKALRMPIDEAIRRLR